MGVLTLRPDLSWTKTGYMDSDNPLLAVVNDDCWIGQKKSLIHKTVVEWDLQGLKWLRGGLRAAQLELYAYSKTGTGTGIDRVRRCRRHSSSATPFTEGASDTGGFCCWDNYSSGNAWAGAGATDTTNDVDTTNSFSWTSPTAQGWVTVCPFSNTSLLNLINDAWASRNGELCLLFELSSRSGDQYWAYKSDGNAYAQTPDVPAPKLTLIFEQSQDVELWTPGGMVVV